ncbi:hypothetical protein AVEN_212404-1 [Araneus ventricosus]|uniref:FCP1 homology domain-containing protein n=1 Tax=Araneus ventricosus TaxID=182803 RepID=A0A4Y2VR66_ARAVE|nr:hypothetical protein AVEN_212404-1 [Araneus ventricosus]
MEPVTVCVLDMDETLGRYDRNAFHVRPKLETFINLLRLLKCDIILWSLGKDDYVRRVVSGHLPEIRDYAYKIFAYKECMNSEARYGFCKASEHIRIMYDCDIFLIGVDDKVSENMDSRYDLRIQVKPYTSPDSKDVVLLEVCEKIINALAEARLDRLRPTTENENDYVENTWVY